jgi:hypothetical protein
MTQQPHDLSNLSGGETALLASVRERLQPETKTSPPDHSDTAVFTAARSRTRSTRRGQALLPAICRRRSARRSDADPGIVPEGPVSPRWNDPEQVLLTGSTGFLGAYLLRELLDRTRAVVHCLVRAPTPEQGKRRLRDTLAERGLWDDTFSDRIVPVLGDLTQPRLGLPEEDFAALAERLDGIYHNGARVNFLARYSALKATNVQGTIELLRLACHRRATPMPFSSVSVVPVFDLLDTGFVPEMDELDPDRPCRAATSEQVVSEKLIHALTAACRSPSIGQDTSRATAVPASATWTTWFVDLSKLHPGTGARQWTWKSI